MKPFPIENQTKCYHCGDACADGVVHSDNKDFCCHGCLAVYDLLKESNLCNYYSLEEKAHISPKLKNFQGRFAFLDDKDTSDKILKFNDGKLAIAIFNLPQMHCSSCVWLLENLYKLDKGVLLSRTDFLKREITIHFSPELTSIRKVVELLTTLGYEPLLNLQSIHEPELAAPHRHRIYQLAVAGFCFANIMMLSFPEYFHIANEGGEQLQRSFSFIILFLSLPTVTYAASDFFVSAWRGIKAKTLNIDFGLSLSIALTFSRSVYEIISNTGSGYLDSMSGIIFFMLIGRFFQERTHTYLNFNRNYKSFFPIAVTIKTTSGQPQSIPLPKLKIGDVLIVRSQELVPADSKCLSHEAFIDYSFVTGESDPVKIRKGEIIYAGGKQSGAAIECEVLKDVSHSYLTNLWNNESFSKEKINRETFVQKLAKNFTVVLLLISISAFIYWLPTDPARGWNALTTVLIVACPCALLLSYTFTNGAIMMQYAKAGVFLKNAGVIETMARATHLVFDKTGTITNHVRSIHFHGSELREQELALIYSVCKQSNHPLSKALAEKLSFCNAWVVDDFTEIPGKGLRAKCNGKIITIGASDFVQASQQEHDAQGAAVFIRFDDKVLGYFSFNKEYRKNLADVFNVLNKKYKLSILSGDNDRQMSNLQSIVGLKVPMFFHQSPDSKTSYIEKLKDEGEVVMMVGDGLNDSGALMKSHVGISISDDVNNFSPACDAIITGAVFSKFPNLVRLATKAQFIIKASFVLSLCYNIVGLSYAVSGTLSPVVAAILMPLSSISIILFTTVASALAGRRLGLAR